MTTPAYDPAIDDYIRSVVDNGSHYRTDAMEALYTADQSILFLDGQGVVARLSRADMMAEFAARGAAGDRPLSTEHRVLHIEQQGDHATALLYRRMDPAGVPAMYELRIRREDGRWQVAGETVLPFPSPEATGDILPKRRAA